MNSALIAFTTTLFAGSLAFAAPTPQSSSQSDASSQSSTTPRKTVKDETRETPKATTKEHTVSVVGKVRSYKAGDSLDVTTPKGHHQSFNLNAKNTTVTGAENVRAGEMVRVTRRQENGKTMISIEPYSAASSRRTDNTGTAPMKEHPKSTNPNKY